MLNRKLEEKIHSIPLKEMDAAVLTYAILDVSSDKMLNRDRINYAIKLAAYLHRNDYRKNRGPLPKTHYIEHPLRNTLRILRWNFFDEDTIIASILHDTVEDHAITIVREFTLHSVEFNDEKKPTVEELLVVRKLALSFIENVFGKNVAFIVEAVSNLPLPAGLTRDQKRKIYAEHVIEALNKDVRIFWVKLSDFVDNALGLYHNNIDGNIEMVKHLVLKYSPLVPVFKELVLTIPMDVYTRVEIITQLDSGSERLAKLGAIE